MATTTVRRPAGVITVHSPELCAQLLDTGTKQHVDLPEQKGVETNTVAPVRNVRQHTSPYLDIAKIDRWLSAKATRGLQEFPPDLELASALQLCSNISREEESFQREFDDFLALQETLGQRKKETLYQKWVTNVFNPIHSRLNEVINGTEYKNYDSKKRELFENYLQYRNKKGYVYLDTMDTREYDAFQLSTSSSTLKAPTKPLDDPLISQLKDQCMEQRVITSCDHGALPGVSIDRPETPQQLCRDDTDCRLWLAMELVQIESDIRKRSRCRMNTSYNDAAAQDDDWYDSKVTSDMILKEMGVPHKTPIHYKRKKINLQWSTPSS